MYMSKPAASSLSRTNRFLAVLWPVLAILCSIALWTVTLSRADSEAMHAEEQVLKEADTYARAYEQYVTRSIAQMDQITMQLKYGWEDSHRPTMLEDMRANGMFTDQSIISVSIVGADGAIRSSTTHGGLPPSVAQTKFFLQHKNNNSTALRVALTHPGFMPNRQLVMFTRRLDRADDEFDGVVVMAIDGAYFTSFVGESTIGRDGLLAIADADGKGWIEQAETSHIVSLSAIGSGAGAPRLAGARAFRDGVTRALGRHASSVYPVVAMVGLSRREGIAATQLNWEASRDRALAASICLLLLSCLASVLSLRAAARECEHEAVRLAYRTATESANDGFYMATPIHDRKGHIVDFTIVDCNERGASFYGMQRADLVGRAVSTVDSGLGAAQIIATYRLAMANGFHEEDRRMPADDRLTITGDGGDLCASATAWL